MVANKDQNKNSDRPLYCTLENGNDGLVAADRYRKVPDPAGRMMVQHDHHATTSAALKLLRRRLMGRKLGRSDFDPGTTTAEALLVIQSCDCAALATATRGSCTDVVD